MYPSDSCFLFGVFVCVFGYILIQIIITLSRLIRKN